ncbi:MAG: hypothetical protein Solumvirus1_34 [Solumvirus sp.]|uniref:Uncharacterized protein n=1 Tax=Solumvirus sp. TaxID=2487773 RepID=A0A3G5AK66_9VIRU|nr:MAG: hypothetical protein Solumvirus1_34 [Solumvirus sp.]
MSILSNPWVKNDPSFKLVGVDVMKITEEYRKGVYKKLVIPSIEIKGGINEHLPILAPSYGNKPEDPIYTFQDKNNTTIVVATTNHVKYSIMKSGDKIKHKAGETCFWCLRKIGTNSMSIPIKMEKIVEEKTDILAKTLSTEATLAKALEDKTSTDTSPITHHLIFYGIHVVCGFRCGLSYIRYHSKIDSKFANSEHYLNVLFNTQFPGKAIIPAQKPELLISNGGSLSDEEFDNPKFYYDETPNVTLLPAKIQFFRKNNE